MDLFYIFKVVSQFNFTNDIKKVSNTFLQFFYSSVLKRFLLCSLVCLDLLSFLSIACTLRQNFYPLHNVAECSIRHQKVITAAIS